MPHYKSMDKIVGHLQKRKRIYLEVALAVIVILGSWLCYRYEETNFEAYLAERFPSQGLSLAQVVSVQNDTSTQYLSQYIVVRFLTGDMNGETTTVLSQAVSSSTGNNYLLISSGEKVLLARDSIEGVANEPYYITDRYRLPAIFFAILLFAIVAVLFGGIRGLTSIIGLAMSIGILIGFVVPQILAGHDPLTTCLIGAAAIALVSLYLAHGFNKRTTVALCGTFITLAASALLAVLFVSLAKLVGLATDQSFYLELGTNISLNLRGLLLGGIIIGALGVLDDVTIGQSATVYELKDANPNLNAKELYKRGMSIGREHIASLINTLFLAYAGISLPVILYLVAFQNGVPLWFALNGEAIAEEIVRTMVGSIGIVLAVPITTLLASWIFSKDRSTHAGS
jgi:uncharacterized membrane protein